MPRKVYRLPTAHLRPVSSAALAAAVQLRYTSNIRYCAHGSQLMDQRSFQQLLRRAVGLPVVLLVGLAVILTAEILLLSNSLRWVDHSNKVITNARQLARYIGEMDASLRGYYLTSDNMFLEGYREARARIPEQIDYLADLTTDNGNQQERLRTIRATAEQWLQWSGRQLAESKAGRPPEATIIAGNKLVQELRDQQREFANAEEALFTERSRRAKRLNETVLASAVGLSMLIVLWLFAVTRPEVIALSESYENHLRAEMEERQKVSESRERFQSTLNSLGEAVISTDKSNAISYINPVAQQLTGWSYLEANGRSFGEVVHLTDERTHQSADDPIELVSRSNDVSSSQDLILTDRHGISRPIELTASPILDRHSQLLGVTVVFRDITQRRQTEQTLRSSERLTLAGRLSATIAHEIRNPLDTVSNLVYLLQRDNPAAAQAQYLSMASEEVARIAQITSQLLTFHRESRSPVAVSLAEVLDSVLAIFAPQIKQNHLIVIKQFDTGKPVRGFPGELRQVFSNLVGNAVDALPHGGKLVLHTRESSMAGDPARKGVRVTVLDTGAGIPVGVRRNLFAPFYTTKGEKGTGLGLWISRSIVQKHEGTIHFSSRTSDGMSGTAFSVFLPFEQKLGLLDLTTEVSLP